jgi:Domain of unknown function (DUF4112)
MTDRSHQIAVNLQPATIAKLERLRYLSNVWDNALRVPGTKLRVGLESIIGLLPFGGDIIGLLLSCYILFHAIQFKLPKTILLRMVSNILIDAIAGVVPIFGDLFDTAWKANTRNVNLLEAHLHRPTVSHSANRRFLLLLWLGIIAIVAILIATCILCLKLLLLLIHFN